MSFTVTGHKSSVAAFISLLLHRNKRYDLKPDSPDSPHYDSFTAATFIASVPRSRAD